MWTKAHLVANEGEWMEHGNCAEGHLPHSPKARVRMMFPSDGGGVISALRVCEGCPVSIECLAYAIENGIDHGVWGGQSERSRQKIRRGLGLIGAG